MVFTVLVLLAIPTILGIIFAIRFPRLTARIKKPVRMLSLLFFALFVILALVSNFRAFREYIHLVFYLVLCHNTLALATGYFTSNLFGLPKPDRKTLTIETGIQNSGLGLVLIFNFFHGLGGMALVAAWWGIWHILSGLVISGYWSRKSNSVEIA
jgi:BASS family bile acid:Na+ symporter